uniref:ParB/Sulfiredoxin domain-containing protein n=1 Tax=Tenacibaculum sp. Pbs-1 TaxID=3238748 RepID=A0AB33KZD7_9FLAO
MNKQVRIQKIQEVINNNKDRTDLLNHEILWEGQLKSKKVYNIPLSYLIYNKYNGRILSRTKSLEKQKQYIDVETEAGRNLIEKLLWDSKIERNKKTEQSIRDIGQQKVGIITKDGVIIDGNRRAMLLNRIDRTGYFKAIVLPVTLEENPIEIERLETTYQMGEDEKLRYNPIEKYLKAKQIFDKLTPKLTETEAINTIHKWMGEDINEIKKYLDTMAIMDEYLEYLDYDGIYTQLDSREDQFLSLTKWLNNFYGETSKKAFDGYSDSDVDELKSIAFDYLRFRNEYDGKEFRNLAEGNSDKHFFGDKDIWIGFSSKHNDIIQKLPQEPEIDFNSSNLEKHLNARDKLFFDSSKFNTNTSAFIENLNDHKYLVGYNKASDAPEKLLKRASQTFDAIKTNHTSFSKPEVQDMVKDFGNKIFSSLNQKSPSRVLSHIIELLEAIEIDNIPENEKKEIFEKSKLISKIGYDIKKSL